MKKILAGVLALSLIAGVAYSQSSNVISSFVIPLLVTQGGTGGTTIALALSNLLGVAHVPDNTTLAGKSTADYSVIWRDDFSAGFGAPPVMYTAGTVACSLNSGAGDGGSQVSSANGKCWLADFPTVLDSRWWGISTNPVIFSVATTGADLSGANYCFPSTPCATVQQAVNQASRFAVNGGSHEINVAAGSYAAGASCSGALPGSANGGLGAGGIVINGAGSTTTTIADASNSPAALIATDGCILVPQNIKVTSTNGSALFPTKHGRIAIGPDFNVGATHFGQFHSEIDGVIEIPVPYTISGSAPAHDQVVLGGKIIYDEVSSPVTITGTPAFSTGFVDAEDSGSLVYIPNGLVSFSGSATGPRAYIKGNATVETNSGTATYLPGSTPIQRVNGGTYLPEPTPSAGTPTGLGSTGTVAMVSGATDRNLIVELSPSGTGIAATGTIPINFAGSLPNLACGAPSMLTGTGGWNTQAVGSTPTFNSTSVSMQWSNNGVALTSGLTYFMSLRCDNY